MFWLLLIVMGIILFNFGALSILVALLLPAFKVALLFIVMLLIMHLWRRRGNN
jgi:hypothetical protein